MNETQWTVAVILGMIMIFGFVDVAKKVRSTRRQVGHVGEGLRKLRRSVRRMDANRRREFYAARTQGAERESGTAKLILGHMHALRETQPGIFNEFDVWTWSITGRTSGIVPPPERITGWQITDSTGKLLQIVPVDADRVEADIVARIAAFHAEHPDPPKEPPALTEEQRQEAKELVAGGTRTEAEYLRIKEERNRVGWEDSRERHEPFVRDQERLVRREVWLHEALDAARKVFPVCRLRSTSCGYDIVL